MKPSIPSTLLVSLLAGVATAPAAQAAEPQLQFFAGTSQVYTASGQPIGTTESLVERILDPDRLTIIERVLGPDREHPGRYAEYVVLMTVDVASSTLTMSERSQAFEGTGTLVGAPWAWTSWHTTSQMPKGVRVESQDELTPAGLRATKRVYGADNQFLVRMSEDLALISAAEFERRYYLWRLR